VLVRLTYPDTCLRVVHGDDGGGRWILVGPGIDELHVASATVGVLRARG
jgi:hypothetical protein